jgi:hypothetical protein
MRTNRDRRIPPIEDASKLDLHSGPSVPAARRKGALHKQVPFAPLIKPLPLRLLQPKVLTYRVRYQSVTGKSVAGRNAVTGANDASQEPGFGDSTSVTRQPK